MGIKPAEPEIVLTKIEGKETTVDGAGEPLVVDPASPLPDDPLPDDPLPAEPLPAEPLPVDPMVLVVEVTPLTLIELELADRQEGHIVFSKAVVISGKAPAVTRSICASLSRSAADAKSVRKDRAISARNILFMSPSLPEDSGTTFMGEHEGICLPDFILPYSRRQ